MKPNDQIYPPGVLIKDQPTSGIKARDFIAIEAMKSMLSGIYSDTILPSASQAAETTSRISLRAYLIADKMIEMSVGSLENKEIDDEIS